MLLLTALVLASTLQFSKLVGGADAAVHRQGSLSDDACLGFSPRDLPGVTVAQRTYYPANATVQISNDYIGIASSNLPAFCRLQLVITTNTTAGSGAETEVWLPDEWNARMLTVGSGGLAGGADVLALGTRAVSRGFAGVSTNGGHNSAATDGSWGGPHDDNAIVDWAWRAVHLSVLAGKEIVKQFYNEAPKKSYYLGCSTGGRQGLKEIQLFPDSFDGAVVGSPANWLSRLTSWGVYLARLVEPATSSRFIPQEVWTGVITPEVMKQCDALDGVSDRVINDPRLCNFRPETLACRPSQDPSTCLNADQIAALRHIYADYYEDGAYVFGGFNPGGEDVYFSTYFQAGPSPLPTGWLEYMVLNDTEWTIDQYNSSVYKIADKINPGDANAIDPDLRAFAAPPRNGKVLHYVGLTDDVISPRNSFHYYDTVRAHVARSGPGGLDVDDFYRLFPVPGMNHCTVLTSGGHGANAFGGVSQPPVAPDAAHDILAALLRWVEHGVAPTTIVATKFRNDTLSEGVAFTRPLCKHPLVVRYRGGDPDEAGSFECA
ncbi:feruloyl esterase-like protein [Trametes versicolor FP-101664 SS1]|uniref:feruloyl esterase-like protein n=1 Tax=Trametes versicolor (strain FP-101664) TaxID=717944 RepID=UPI0004623F73|nr:feruloyl esterase-like protein [Trametes versicolor FP-101664 SS1]EIW55264.1 feruloyl esterase-like protein [Trametes versicolor FP-101664 SS1]